MKHLLAVFALIALTSCEPNELYPAGGALPFSGGNSGGNTAPAPAQSIPPHAIIDNPDEASHQDWDYIWADSETEAIRKCQALAESNGTIYVSVRRASQNSKRYECYWRT